MGVVQSSIGGTTEAAAVGAAFLAGTATAYTVYKQRFAASATTDKSTNVSGEKATATASGTKKNNYKSKKGGNAEDAELDALLARAKAEKEEAARRLERASSKGVIPGSFELDGVEVSSEVEGREKKARRKGKKKGASAAAPTATVGEGSGAVSSTRGEGVDKATAPSSTSKLADSPVQANVSAPTTTELTAGSLKQKKRKAAKAADNTTAIPSGSTTAAPASSSNVNKPAGTAPSLQSSQALGMSVTMSDAPDDASWTRVSTRKKNINDNQTQQAVRRETSQTDPELFTSDTNVTTSGVTDENTEEDEAQEEEDEGSVREPEHRRTFAEKMLPKPRKTGVEDMEDEPLQPTLSRVMRITPKPGEKPAKGFSWADYEEYAGADGGTSADGDEDDAWEEVKSKKKLGRSTSALTSSVDSLSLSQPQSQTQAPAPGKQTKRQRQNAKRKESKQLEKQAQEQEQRDRLAKHQRELERERIKEQYATPGGGSGKKNVSGGMKASVEGGKLVWD
ncbi:uncharacterized protein FOMMEDRAFT_143921 [Fomitiporia mediterranea MF3/22]|uniref:uncharacterized protein n=1 Tax=Fomitiporia mediterranea (strain MF3/22) TaxID=694068 RepID=UPI00044092AB|nr:uncharacterized protein FOMMEDRAFT_143921 [Fomitiporia mediterranea MF3/22]EJD07574.1 hypothetical protein FOMMEDRAFT_143921 [Fomitiporia mediterranea MF3/22]